jgi:3-dehydroquinate dehydratase-1
MPQSEEDVSRLLSVAKAVCDEFDRPLIAIAMGRLGTVSRTEGERYGSAMTFAALGQGSAPGQIPVDQLRRELERVHAEIS